MLNSQINFFYSTSPPINVLSLPPASVLHKTASCLAEGLRDLSCCRPVMEGVLPVFKCVCAFERYSFAQRATENARKSESFHTACSNLYLKIKSVFDFTIQLSDAVA